MGGGAWPFLVGVAISLVNFINKRDLSLLTSYVVASLHGRLLSGTMAAGFLLCLPIPWLCVHPCPRLQFWLDRTHSFRISPNPSTKNVKENATKQPAFANPEQSGLPIDSGRGPMRIKVVT
ncbi:unnamed protein product [Brassica rapa subsp. narinosa]